jgi:TolB-like protein/Flp pilus assembly protein TadD
MEDHELGRSMPEPSSPTAAVFLSYASQDAEAAARICEALRASGVEVWFDQSELRGGDAWDSKIKKQIHECSLFIPLISAHTNARTEGYFRREWKLAARRLLDLADDAAFLVPVVIDGTREAHARVPEEFLGVQWTRLLDGETPPTFTLRIRQLLGSDNAAKSLPQSTVTATIESGSRGRGSALPNAAPRAWRVGFAVVALLLVLGGGIFFWYYQRVRDVPSTQHTPEKQSPLAEAAIHEKSIAVLPFVNMSSDKEQEYFSDGLSEELLNLLAKVPELRVAARTSSFYFKGKDIKLSDVARELRVENVLEGSVRKSGNRVRITAQLIRASDGYHVWSETYDRTLEDIFTVQEEIAAAVVSQLKATLLGAPPKVHKTTPEAYALYLQAQQLSRQGTNRREDSIALYKQVLAIDPDYVPAWFWLAAWYMGPTEEDRKLARETFGKALAIDPDYAPAHAALGSMALHWDNDLAASARHLEHALELDPTDPVALFVGMELNEALGRLNKSVAMMEYLVSRDPMDFSYHYMLGTAYIDAGRLDDAIGSFRAALKLAPNALGLHAGIGDALLLKRQYEAAMSEYRSEPNEPEQLAGLACAHYSLGQHRESDAILAKLIKKHADSAYLIATTFAWRGERGRAFEWLEKMAATRQSLAYTPVNLWLNNLHADSRWLPFLRKIGKAPEQLAEIKFELRVPTH